MTTREITPESVFLENLRYQGLEGVVERIDRFQLWCLQMKLAGESNI